MSEVQWNAASGGSFNSLLNWLGGALPGASDTAVLGDLGAPYKVVSQAGVLGLGLGGTQAVGAVQTAAGSTLEILGGIDLVGLAGGSTNFLAANGTGGGVNAGEIEVQNALYTVPVVGTLLGGSADFEIGGVFDNLGSIVLNGQPTSALPAADQKSILTILGKTTLDGGGLITLSNDAFNLITGGEGAVLDNVDNLISGAGKLTGIGLINEAAAAIDADQALPFELAALGTAVNAGVLEATHGGTLKLGGNIDNLGGKILADGGRVILAGVTITDGTLAAGVQGAFTIETIGNGLTGDGLYGINLDGLIEMYANANLTISGAINNFGELLIHSGKGASTTDLLVGGAGAILSGGGEIFLSAASSLIAGVTSAATLTNLDNLITGSGLLGAGELTLINGLAGVIEGAGPTGLTLDTGGNTIENAGLIAGGKHSQTTVESAVDNTGVLASGGGVLTVLGAVTGDGSGVVHGGVLAFGSAFGENVAFQGRGVLRLAQSQTYDGVISGFSRSGSTVLDVEDIRFVGAGEASWSGGVLTVSDGTHTARITLAGNYAHSVFVANGDGEGGTDIVIQPASSLSIPAFVAAAASLAPEAATPLREALARPIASVALARPHAALA